MKAKKERFRVSKTPVMNPKVCKKTNECREMAVEQVDMTCRETQKISESTENSRLRGMKLRI
jgi:hypothetical protein